MENKRLEVPSMSYGTAIPELPLTIGAVHQSASRPNLLTILYHVVISEELFRDRSKGGYAVIRF